MSTFKSFKDMKKNRGALRKQIEEAVKNDGKSSTSRDEDARSWYPKKGEKGSFSTTIRFLPPAAGNNLPWAKRYRHAFQDPNTKLWLFENCPTTIGKDCPICDANKELWNTEIESNRKIASQRKRKLDYFYNIYVLKDGTQEGQEGQNKIFKSGVYIFNMIQDALNPKFDEDTPIDAFDLWEGADFNFKMHTDEAKKQITYERSEFAVPSEFKEGDEAGQEEVYNGMFDLNEFTDEKLFNSFEDIQKNFLRVTGPSKRVGPSTASAQQEKSVSADSNKVAEAAAEAALETPAAETDDAMAMFEELANS